MANVEKSSVVTQKEQELLLLQKKRKKLLTQLKRNQTILDNLQYGITQMQQQIASRIPDIVMEIQRIKERLTDLFRQAKKSRKIPKHEKVGLDDFIKAFDAQNPFEDFFGMDMDEFEATRSKAGFNTDEFDRQKAFEFFSEYKVETKEEDKREIRKSFIRLANRFHPDKAKSKREKEQFHQLMQQINSAYERNDLAALVHLEEEYGSQKTLADHDITNEGAIIDLLDVEVDRIGQEMSLLENQLKRIKQELKNIRKSDLGKAYTMEQDSIKYGMESSEDMIDALEEQKQQLGEVEEGMKEYVKTGIMPEIIYNFFIEDEDDEEEDFFLEDDNYLSVEELLSAFENMMEDYDPPAPKKRKKRRKR